ncbi:MAG TPA: long-chain fatty acid--CoA ligase [Candidatus Limnocylindria bacterium]|nr:long-chain fatty acid--CoA ligase [Candidatus Limnocylindria bacterium]
MLAAETLCGILLNAVAAHRKPAQFMRKGADGWESLSGERALADVESLSLALQDLGLARGDRLALLSENRYEWPVADLAVLGAGAVTVPIYPTLLAQQVRFLLENSEAKLAVVSTPAQLEKIRVAAEGLPALKAIVFMDGASTIPREHAFANLLERGAGLRARQPDAYRISAASVAPTDLATIIYTSGTTGEPKGAMLTHGNIVSNVRACLQVMALSPGDTCLSFLPLCHIFERMGGLYSMLDAGVTIAYAENLEAVAENAREVRPTVLMGVPRFYEKVYARVLDGAQRMPPLRQRLFHWGLRQGQAKARAHFERRRLSGLAAWQAGLADRLVAAKIRERVGGRLRFCISGGAALPASIMEFFFAIGIPIYEGYGLTETSPVICLNPPEREKPGSVGPPIPGVEVRIGDQGEILTRGPHVMQGYFKNEPATRQALRDGWFHTGDVGHLDADGYLVITDRLKDLLVTAGGKKIAPQPIEARLKTNPWVSEAVLLGDGRPFVVGLIVPDFTLLEAEARKRGWAAKDRASLITHPEVIALYEREIESVNGELAQFEKIKRFAILDRELTQESGELTPTLKVKRRVIVQRFAERIEELYRGHARPEAPQAARS